MRGMIPAQAPYKGREPTMRKGSYSEELVRIVRTHWPCNSDSVNHRRRDHEDVDDEHLDGDAPDAHVIADGQTAETCGHEANILKLKVPKISETL